MVRSVDDGRFEREVGLDHGVAAADGQNAGDAEKQEGNDECSHTSSLVGAMRVRGMVPNTHEADSEKCRRQALQLPTPTLATVGASRTSSNELAGERVSR